MTGLGEKTPAHPTPLTEDSPLRDRLFHYRDEASGPDDWAYHYDKIRVERTVMSRPDELPSTVLRLPMVFGPGDYQHRLFSFLKRIDDKRPLSFFLKAKRTFEPFVATSKISLRLSRSV